MSSWNLFLLTCGGAGMTGKKKLPIGIDIFEKMDRESTAIDAGIFQHL